MTTALSIENPTMLDVQNSIDKNGDFAYVADMLRKRNDFWKYMNVIPANEGSAHRSFVNISLPTTYRRQFNKGVSPSFGKNQPIVSEPGMFTSSFQIDKKLADRHKNTNKFRFDQGNLHFEALAQDVSNTTFYGNTLTNEDDFPGLAYYYSDPTAENGEHIVDGGGSGSDMLSAYMLVFGDNAITHFYPTGSTGGFEHINHGTQRAHNYNGETGKTLTVYEDEFNIDLGLAVPDYRCGARACNIDKSALLAGVDDADLGLLFDKLIVLTKDCWGMGRAVLCMNDTLFFGLLRQRKATVEQGGGVTWDNVDGMLIYKYMNVPIAICNSLVEEQAVTGF